MPSSSGRVARGDDHRDDRRRDLLRLRFGLGLRLRLGFGLRLRFRVDRFGLGIGLCVGLVGLRVLRVLRIRRLGDRRPRRGRADRPASATSGSGEPGSGTPSSAGGPGSADPEPAAPLVDSGGSIVSMRPVDNSRDPDFLPNRRPCRPLTGRRCLQELALAAILASTRCCTPPSSQSRMHVPVLAVPKSNGASWTSARPPPTPVTSPSGSG